MTAETANPKTLAYLKTQVLTAPPERLRLMLLEGGVRFLRQGRDGLTRKDYSASYEGFSQARAIVIELMNSVRPDIAPDLCARVQSLYTFIFQTIVEASLEKSIEKADKAIELVEFERETWAMAIEKLAEERAGAAISPTFSPSPARDFSERRPLSIQG
jgi:flagellar protein FliS